jgi:hypothetical protein
MGTHEMFDGVGVPSLAGRSPEAIGNSRKGNQSFFRLSEVRPNHPRLRISARFSKTWLDVAPEPEVTVWSYRTHDLFNERTKR